MDNRKIAFFLPNLYGGGAERVAINLLKGMVKTNISLDLVLAEADGPYLNHVPDKVQVINFKANRVIKAILPLSNYLRTNQPSILVSHMSHANLIALLARSLAGTKTKLVLVEHDTLSASRPQLKRAKLIPPLLKWLYPNAEAIVGVSQGVSEDLQKYLDLPKEKIHVIYNPVVDDELLTKAQHPVNHPWFQPDSPPVFLAVGRLTEQKDFSTLLDAFALVKKQRSARLIILGEGESRTQLQTKIDDLQITEDVSLPGFVENPYSYMSRANAFVLSSRWEGLGNVLIEAMACGCPVIATDCPSGPREILADGKYGFLTPVGDAVELSQSMLKVLESPPSRDVLVNRASYFSVQNSVNQYLSL